jgi:hypothetical protein
VWWACLEEEEEEGGGEAQGWERCIGLQPQERPINLCIALSVRASVGYIYIYKRVQNGATGSEGARAPSPSFIAFFSGDQPMENDEDDQYVEIIETLTSKAQRSSKKAVRGGSSSSQSNQHVVDGPAQSMSDVPACMAQKLVIDLTSDNEEEEGNKEQGPAGSAAAAAGASSSPASSSLSSPSSPLKKSKKEDSAGALRTSPRKGASTVGGAGEGGRAREAVNRDLIEEVKSRLKHIYSQGEGYDPWHVFYPCNNKGILRQGKYFTRTRDGDSEVSFLHWIRMRYRVGGEDGKSTAAGDDCGERLMRGWTYLLREAHQSLAMECENLHGIGRSCWFTLVNLCMLLHQFVWFVLTDRMEQGKPDTWQNWLVAMCLRIKALDKGDMVLNDVERLDLLGKFRQGSWIVGCT